jgi:hypothetical protein
LPDDPHGYAIGLNKLLGVDTGKAPQSVTLGGDDNKGGAVSGKLGDDGKGGAGSGKLGDGAGSGKLGDGAGSGKLGDDGKGGAGSGKLGDDGKKPQSVTLGGDDGQAPPPPKKEFKKDYIDSPVDSKEPILSKLVDSDAASKREYGYGFWLRFLTLYPKLLLNGKDAPWYFVARLAAT